MKRLLIIAAFVSAIYADESVASIERLFEKRAERSAPAVRGKPTWTLTATGNKTFAEFQMGPVRLWQKPAPAGLQDSFTSRVDANSLASRELLISKEEVPTIASLLAKFAEWCAVAKKNNVRDFSKALGPIGESNSSICYFVVPRNGVPIFRVGDEGRFILDESEVPIVSALLAQMPQIEAEMKRGKAKGAASSDPRDALFK